MPLLTCPESLPDSVITHYDWEVSEVTLRPLVFICESDALDHYTTLEIPQKVERVVGLEARTCRLGLVLVV